MFAFLSADSSFTGSSNLGLKKQKIYDEIFILSIFWGRISSSGSVLASPQTSFGVRSFECVTNEPQRTSAGRLVVCLTVEWKVMVLIPGGPIFRVLK